MQSRISIHQIQEHEIPGYYEALCSVIAERKYLGFLDPPPCDGSVQFVKDNLAKKNVHLVVVDQATNTVVGWCDIYRVSARPLFSHIGHLGTGIIDSHGGCGIGRKLIRAAVTDAISKGLSRIELEVFRSNERAIGLYASEGFVHEGTKRGHARFPDRIEDSLTMAYLAST